MASPNPVRMSAVLRSVIYLTFGALWMSGGLWLVLHWFWAQQTDFGPAEHPWAPGILRWHGWIAVVAVFLLGWITAEHVSDRWSQMRKRASGLSVAGVAVILIATGYALYYTTDRFHDAAALVHEVLGAAAILFGLVHWRPYRRRQAERTRLA